MTRWIPYAFVRIVVFFIAGILWGVFFPEWLEVDVAAYVLMGLAGGYGMLIIYQRKFNRLFGPGFVALAVFVLAGYVHVRLKTEPESKDHLIYIADTVSFYHVVMTSFPEEKEKTWKATGEIKEVRTAGGWRACSGKVLLYFNKEDFSCPWQYGDELIIEGSPPVVAPPANPHAFDYKRFLSYRNICHRHFVRRDQVRFVRNDPPHAFMAAALKVRGRAQAVLREHIPGDEERAIASALVLGITDGLDNEMTGAYAAAGAMHILAVSGLHVGVIYWLVLLVFRPLNRLRHGKWALALVSISILWCYAFVTGLSPSVLRAVTMFTVMALARPWRRHANIYNTLAVSAFCLLLYDPYLIMAVGFQLSYTAVAGIVYFFPRLHLLWAPSSWLMSMVWKITCVSVAAQLATFPIALLYFHQFPLYFPVSNLFVIPLSFLALALGLLLVVVSFITPLAHWAGVAVMWVIKTLNAGVFMVESWPYSLLEGVYITPFQCGLLMGLVAVFVLLLELKRFRMVYAGLALAVLFGVAQWRHYAHDVNNRKLTVYSVYGHTAMDLSAYGRAWFFADQALRQDEAGLRFNIEGNRVAGGITRVLAGEDQPFVRTFQGCRLILWQGRKILQVFDRHFGFAGAVPVDYVVVSRNAVRNVAALAQRIKFGQLIIDSSNSWYVAGDLLEQAVPGSRPHYSVLHSGAFQIEI